MLPFDMLNTQNFEAISQALPTRATQLASKSASHQPTLDAITERLSGEDNNLLQIINTPDPGPRTDLDFSALDAAVAVFKENANISQTDAGNLAGLVKINTPA